MLTLVLWALGCNGSDGSGDSEGGSTTPPACAATFEFCDGQDNDCDGTIDEIYDLDLDGFLADDAGCRAMGVPIDCNDLDVAIFPGAEDDDCDLVDDDCSGVPDDQADHDGDGYFCDDCNDDDNAVFPGALEQCDGIDNDCNYLADEQWDEDGDGVSPCGGDCNERDPLQSPLTPESCDGVDNDCDGTVDEDFDIDADGVSTCEGDCEDTHADVYPGAPEICDDLDSDCDGNSWDAIDVDKDGFTICTGDCIENNGNAFPGATESCDDIDNDCNGMTDEQPNCYNCTVDGDLWICTQNSSWEEAVAICAGVGGELAIIEDAKDEATVESYAAGSTKFWIALSDADKEGLFVWPDGTEPTYTDWDAGYPSDPSGVRDCVYIDSTGWQNANCGGNSGFVCRL